MPVNTPTYFYFVKINILLFLGGYNFSNTAKLWAAITALVVGVKLDQNIPEHDLWPLYRPDYSLSIQPLLSKDRNSRFYLDNCIAKITGSFPHFYLLSSRQSVKKYNIP